MAPLKQGYFDPQIFDILVFDGSALRPTIITFKRNGRLNSLLGADYAGADQRAWLVGSFGYCADEMTGSVVITFRSQGSPLSYFK